MTPVRGQERGPVVWAALLVVVTAALLGALVVLVGTTWVRAPAAVLWMLAMPGLPWAVRLRLGDWGDTAAVAVGISVALAALVGGGMAALGWWSPLGAVLVLTGAGLGAAFTGAVRKDVPPPSSAGSP
jgi:hypothetical protein